MHIYMIVRHTHLLKINGLIYRLLFCLNYYYTETAIEVIIVLKMIKTENDIFPDVIVHMSSCGYC